MQPGALRGNICSQKSCLWSITPQDLCNLFRSLVSHQEAKTGRNDTRVCHMFLAPKSISTGFIKQQPAKEETSQGVWKKAQKPAS